MRTVALSFAALSLIWIAPQANAQVNSFVVVPARVDLALQHDEQGRRAWKRSLIAVAVSQSLDVVSSYGMGERNPLLQSADGRFGSKAASIKIGATLGVIALEYVLVKKYPKAARIFSKLNWASSIVTTGFAVHNFAIR